MAETMPGERRHPTKPADCDDNVVRSVNGDRTSRARHEQIRALAGEPPQRRWGSEVHLHGPEQLARRWYYALCRLHRRLSGSGVVRIIRPAENANTIVGRTRQGIQSQLEKFTAADA